ncbi:hypothetical protein TNIN_458811 [Trichonephila inaurata madagascariensis]|uniref:Uncharacterized protein n=1 Tax=Trichonephila inaurata madagascariensis TaxID=2747483 RepID=A0A8X7C689_9ARAC|nr:hypothetical protein TNIN_458811 [Trichonephila inaurata madagascariensis]
MFRVSESADCPSRGFSKAAFAPKGGKVPVGCIFRQEWPISDVEVDANEVEGKERRASDLYDEFFKQILKGIIFPPIVEITSVGGSTFHSVGYPICKKG